MMKNIIVTFIAGKEEDFNYHDWDMDYKTNGDWVEIYAINGLKEKKNIAAFNREAMIRIRRY